MAARMDSAAIAQISRIECKGEGRGERFSLARALRKVFAVRGNRTCDDAPSVIRVPRDESSFR